MIKQLTSHPVRGESSFLCKQKQNYRTMRRFKAIRLVGIWLRPSYALLRLGSIHPSFLQNAGHSPRSGFIASFRSSTGYYVDEQRTIIVPSQ